MNFSQSLDVADFILLKITKIDSLYIIVLYQYYYILYIKFLQRKSWPHTEKITLIYAQFSHYVISLDRYVPLYTFKTILYNYYTEARNFRLELSYAIQLYDYIMSKSMRKYLEA